MMRMKDMIMRMEKVYIFKLDHYHHHLWSFPSHIPYMNIIGEEENEGEEDDENAENGEEDE